MARKTKFDNLLSEEDEKRSSKRRSVSSEVKREARKEYARRKKENKQKQKRLKKLGKNRNGINQEQVFDAVSNEQNEFANVPETQVVEPKIEPVIAREESESSKTSHIDFDELKKAQEELRREQGFEEPEIDYSYKKATDEDSEPVGQSELSLSNPFTEKQPPFVPVAEDIEEDNSLYNPIEETQLPANLEAEGEEEAFDDQSFEEDLEEENKTPFAFDFSHIKDFEETTRDIKNQQKKENEIKEEAINPEQEEIEEAIEDDAQPKHNVNVTMADGSPVPSNLNLNISINIPEGVKSSETIIRHEGEAGDTNVNVAGSDDVDDDLTRKALAEFGAIDDFKDHDEKEIDAEPLITEKSDADEDDVSEKTTASMDTIEEKANEDEKPQVVEENEAKDLDPVYKKPEVEETKELPEEYKGNDHVSRISNDEIEAMKRQIAFERGEITEEEYLAGPNNLNKPEPEVKAEEIEQAEQEIVEESAEESEEAVEDEGNKALEEIKRAARRKDEGLIAPEESLPDSITDEDIEEHFHEQEKEEQKKLEAEDLAEYNGMTEEEIAVAKERKRKLQELKARYNTKENTQAGNEGDYRKNLDFSINTSIKRFRVKPPKKPIIIAVASVLALFLIVGVVAYFILNKPPAPVVMSSVSLSQTYTYQYVGDELDIRGLYADCHYSDGSIRKVKLTKEMITRKSLNINEHNIILDYDELDFEIPEGTSKTTFVYFNVNGFEAKLDIRITELVIESISAELVGQYFMVSDIVNFDNFLILAKTTSDYYVRINAKDCQLTINGLVIQSNDDGFIIPGDYKGTHELLIEYNYNNTVVSTTIDITIKES